jgi:hypothetical protein
MRTQAARPRRCSSARLRGGRGACLRGLSTGLETILKKRGVTIAATAIETYIERGLS